MKINILNFKKITKLNSNKLVFTISLLFISLISFSLSQGSTPRGFPATPKALDLDNHFGSEPVQNKYGPQAHVNQPIDIAREYDTVDGIRSTTPIRNLHTLNPKEIIHGNLDNTAYDASLIITPEYASPKAKINTTFVHDAVVNTPVQVATHHETKDVSIMNRVTGEVTNKTITTEKPVLSIIKNLRKVSTDKTTYVNMNNNSFYDTNAKTGLVGI